MIRWVKDDIINLVPKASHVAHGCNCYHTMGSGVAKALNNYTNGGLLRVDRDTPYGDINKLGGFSILEKGGVMYANLYTQHGYGRNGVHIHWKSLREALTCFIGTKMIDSDVLLIPPIGTGLAGGNMHDFRKVLDELEWDQLPKIQVIICCL